MRSDDSLRARLLSHCALSASELNGKRTSGEKDLHLLRRARCRGTHADHEVPRAIRDSYALSVEAHRHVGAIAVRNDPVRFASREVGARRWVAVAGAWWRLRRLGRPHAVIGRIANDDSEPERRVPIVGPADASEKDGAHPKTVVNRSDLQCRLELAHGKELLRRTRVAETEGGTEVERDRRQVLFPKCDENG